MKNEKVLIFGVGWLGLPLAFSLKDMGFDVFTASRSLQKCSQLNDFGFKAIEISCHFDSVKIQLNIEQLNEINYLIICIPPTGVQNYKGVLESIVSKFNDKTKIIFTSSTGIYEEINDNVDEESDKISDHPVYLSEKKLLEIAGNRLTILRLAGLIGANRHPIKYLIQKDLIPNCQAPVNLVCQKDVIRAINLIIEKQIFGAIFNIVNPSHPTKKHYYLAAAKEFFEAVPRTAVGNGGKLVLGTKFEREIGFQYLFKLDDWNEFLLKSKSH
jgi:nucleoside-diphosphate-sugar epimerase